MIGLIFLGCFCLLLGNVCTFDFETKFCCPKNGTCGPGILQIAEFVFQPNCTCLIFQRDCSYSEQKIQFLGYENCISTKEKSHYINFILFSLSISFFSATGLLMILEGLCGKKLEKYFCKRQEYILL